ncbi:class II aldolase/adducin family protein [Rhizobiaceae sp. 2RAB30]
MTKRDDMRRNLCNTYLAMGSSGLIFLAAGNVSARSGDGMIISPAGASASSITPEAFVECDFAGQASDSKKPSSEWAMHSAIYKAFPQAHAVVHTHSNYCVAVAATGDSLPAFHYMVAAFGGNDVRCTPYVQWATPDLADAAVKALEGRTACLLGNHGMISHGKSLQAAFNAALRLETLCMQYVLARQAGIVRTLSAEQMVAANARYASYG